MSRKANQPNRNSRSSEEGLTVADMTADRIMNSLVDGIFVCNLDTKIVFTNDKASRLLGYSKEEFLLMHDLIDFFPNSFHYTQFKRTFDSQEKIPYFETEVLRKDQTVFSANFSLSTIYDQKNFPIFRLIIVRDSEEITIARRKGTQLFHSYAISQLTVVVYFLDRLGPHPVYTENLPFLESNEEAFYIRAGVFYMTAVGQGTSHALGLFGPLPVATHENFYTMLYTFLLNNPEAEDIRKKGKDYCMMALIFPKSLEGLFSDRRRIRDEIKDTLHKVNHIREIDDDLILQIKKQVIFKDLEVPLSQRILERKLSAIYEFQRDLAKIASIDQTFQYFATFAEKTLNFSLFSIALLDEVNQDIYFPAHIGYDPDYLDLDSFRIKIDTLRSVVAHVIRTGEVMNIGDVTKSKNYFPAISGINSEACVPVLLRGRVVGTVNAESEELDNFDDNDLKILHSLAGQVSLVLENKDYERKIKALMSLNRRLATISSLTSMYESIRIFVQEVLKFQVFSMDIIDQSTKEFVLVESIGHLDENYAQRMPWDGESSVVRAAAHTGQVQYIPDVSKNPRYIPVNEKVLSELCVPMKCHDRVIGVLNFESFYKDAFNADDIEIVETLADILTTIWVQKHLEEKLKALFTLTQALTTVKKPIELGAFVTEFARSTLGFEIFSLSLLNEKKQTLDLLTALGYSNAKKVQVLPLKSAVGVVPQAARSGKVIFLPDVRKEPLFISISPHVLSEIALPIMIEGKVLGVINVESRLLNAFTDEEQELLRTLTVIVGQTLARLTAS